MADQELRIKLQLDKSLAVQNSKDYHAGERQRIKETAEAAKKAEKEKAQAAKDAAKEAADIARDVAKTRKEADKQVAESGKSANEQIRRENKATVEQQRTLDRDRLWAWNQSESARIAAAKRTAQATIEAEKAADKARGESVTKYVWDVRRKRQEERKAEEERKKAQEDTATSLDQLALRYVGIGAAVKAIDMIGDAWKRVADQQRQAHAEYIEILKNSRVGAAVSGSTPKQYAAETAALSASSGMPIAEADTFVRQFEGTVPIGFQKGNIDRNTADKVKAEGAKFGARLGGDQGTRGELLGILPQFGKIGSAKDAMGKMEAIRLALTEGRGDDSPLTRSLLNVAGKLGGEGGMVGSLEENAALVGTTSLAAGPLMADTRAIQLTRATRGTTAKTMQKTEDAFGLKVGNTLSLEDRLEKIIPKLRDIQGRGEDVVSWLTTNLEMPQEEAEALREFMPNFEVFKERAAKARETAQGGGDAVVAENAAFGSTDLGRSMQAKAEGEAGRFLLGEKQKGFQGLAAKYGARRSKDDSLGTAASDIINSLGAKIFSGIGTPEENDTLGALRDEIEKRGLRMPANASGVRAGFTPPVQQGTAMMDTLRQAGVDPFQIVQGEIAKAITKPLDQVVEESKKQTEELKKLNRPPLPQGAPAQGRARAGG